MFIISVGWQNAGAVKGPFNAISRYKRCLKISVLVLLKCYFNFLDLVCFLLFFFLETNYLSLSQKKKNSKLKQQQR